MESRIYLNGLALANYKGIGNDIQYIGPFQRFNFFIGENNSGKSTVLEFLHKYSRELRTTDSQHAELFAIKLSELEKNVDTQSSRPITGTCTHRKHIIDCATESSHTLAKQENFLEISEAILDIISDSSGLVWINPLKDHAKGTLPLKISHRDILDKLPPEIAEALHTTINSSYTQKHYNPLDATCSWVSTLLAHANINTMKSVSIIPALRKITGELEQDADFSGTGFIEKLLKIQNPDGHGKHVHEPFNKINDFLKSVIQNDSARIEISHSKKISVTIDGKMLPLSSLGTGIHQIIILATACTILRDQLVCIEEPELHLHPTLQRRLIKYLNDKTSNQYFIATHSPTIIDSPNSSIFHVKSRENCTYISLASCSNTKNQVIQDLGYKASDLLQTNCIIWVEGPSDRIYVNHWIKNLDASLVEGLHYSIMFYGGRLLSHLSAEKSNDTNEDIDALIAVHKLNQNLAFIIDSDISKERPSINDTKIRIRDEIKRHHGICWITEGREIENYIPPTMMRDSLSSTYKSFEAQLETGPLEHVLPFKKNDGTVQKTVDKVKIAHSITEHDADLTVMDLKPRMEEIIYMIHRANHMTAPPKSQ